MEEGIKAMIFATVDDLVSDFLFYDRKEDEELPLGAIQEALLSGEIQEREIVECFARKLREALGS
jgi:hypothetical protein